MGTPPASEHQHELDAEETIRIPRPAIDIPVTPAVLETLGDYEPLRPGMVLKDRYRVEEVLHESVEENLYRISDRRGYLHCWACGAIYPETRDPDPYCSNCGADMVNKPYRLREHVHTGEATQPDLLAQAEAAKQAEAEAQAAAPTTPEAGAAPGPASAPPAEASPVAELLPPVPPPPDMAEAPAAAEAEQQDWPTQPMKALDSFIIGSRHYHVEALVEDAPAFALGVTLVSGARSDVGKTRRGSPNEDSILVIQASRIHESFSQPVGLYIVADGLGGHDDGQAASRKAVAVIAETVTRDLLLPAFQSGAFPDSEEIGTKLKGAIEAANIALVDSNEQTRSDMGSTVTGALVVGDTAYIINVGDSRTYLYDTVSLRPISVDHSLVMQLVIGGLIERDDIYTHPQRNQILRSLGDRRDLPVDLFVEKLRPGYQLVICCDGLWEMIRDGEIEQLLREASDPQKAADTLMQTANDNGGEDNISVIVVQARE
jgi:serine/threonine protein phosphatase PrpC